jgi:hypothetical protein
MEAHLDSLLVLVALGGAVAYFAVAMWRRRRAGRDCGCSACGANGRRPIPDHLRKS